MIEVEVEEVMMYYQNEVWKGIRIGLYYTRNAKIFLKGVAEDI